MRFLGRDSCYGPIPGSGRDLLSGIGAPSARAGQSDADCQRDGFRGASDQIDGSPRALTRQRPRLRYLPDSAEQRLAAETAVKRRFWGLTGRGELGFARTRRIGTARLA